MGMNINKDVANAFWSGEEFNRCNTQVYKRGGLASVVDLHNSTIAYRDNEGAPRVSFAGYPTHTTAGRLNAILQRIGHSAQYARGGMISGVEVDPRAWYICEEGKPPVKV